MNLIKSTLSATFTIAISASFLLLGYHTKANVQRKAHSHEYVTNYPNNIKAVIHTNLGQIQLVLFAEKAPETVKNFINYAENGHYNDTIFHRVIEDFIIQGGGYKVSLDKITQFPAIKNEASKSLPNKRGTIAMSRANTPNSARSQFFFNMADNDSLDIPHGYTVFGKIVSGLELLDYINRMPKIRHDALGHKIPARPVVVKKVHILYPRHRA